MKNAKVLFAGFGGQGILFMGKVVAYAGMIGEKNVSWLPSYGPEMRGGTANCSVILSDIPVAAPMVTYPNLLVAMNKPSLDRFIDNVERGGEVFLDSSLIEEKVEMAEVKAYYIPATKLADEHGYQGLANMVMLGKILKETGLMSLEELEAGLKKSIPASKAHLLEANLKAVRLGMEN